MPSENTTLFPTTHFSKPMSAFIPPQLAPDFSKFFMPSYDLLPFAPMEFSGIYFNTFGIDVFFDFDPTFNASILRLPLLIIRSRII
ncbi:hypothetical protein B0H17DRAFT_1218039 [Mycena rosella]|uniref:Uncharacterized protein n=1 Tax=Mycena rosella TaxID=1033263 RepID=A0AAD7FN24_MYCRO|nr:hypothetical protein B0H17DRAFT_1218039 [Mycena rosella]